MVLVVEVDVVVEVVVVLVVLVVVVPVVVVRPTFVGSTIVLTVTAYEFAVPEFAMLDWMVC